MTETGMPKTIAEHWATMSDRELEVVLPYVTIDGKRPTMAELRAYLRKTVKKIRESEL